jgi:hypothetical protein
MPCRSGPHCIRWLCASRLAVVELVEILGIVAGPWHSRRCDGGGGW